MDKPDPPGQDRQAVSKIGSTSKKEVIPALALIAFNAVYVSQLLKLPFPFARGEPGPAFLPILLSAVLFAASIALLTKGLKAGADGETSQVDFARPALVVISTAGFITLLHYYGYWVAAPLYAFCIAMVFEFSGTDRFARCLGFSVLIAGCLTVIGWLFFEILFDLSLPTGVS